MSYNLLFFSGIKTQVDGESIELTPQFSCPNCQGKVLTQKIVVSNAETVDFNQQVTFTMPCCNVSIQLYVAVHKDAEGHITNCMSIEPIAENWWYTVDENI
ncbi:MAG: hypothetical protein ACQCN3_06325 [Candidatus Bathyarchaeia archaeon]|jgi:hypothetical protein